MKIHLLIVTVLVVATGQAADFDSEFAAGRDCYAHAQFRKAAAHFELALQSHPEDAATNYWAGMSYQGLADTAIPFGGRHRAKARAYLTRAAELAPDRPEYRRELFDLLTDSISPSRDGIRKAAEILRTTPEGDPDQPYLQRRLANERSELSSVEARLGQLFLGIPRAAHSIAGLEFIEWLRNCYAGGPF